MDAKAEPGAVCHLIVVTDQPDGEAPVAWLPPPASNWRLPSFPGEQHRLPEDAESIRQALAVQWAVDGHVLCHLACKWNSDPGQREQVAVIEAARASLPADWRPLDMAGLLSASFENQNHFDLLQRWLSSSQPGALPPQRVAWARPGWRARAEEWIRQQLGSLGLTLTGPITTRKLWSISCLLRVPTSDGDYYFKAVPPLFGREPALTDVLARRHPGQVPQVVALEAGQGWMLMRGFSGTMLRESDDLAVWQAAVRAYAAIQIDWRADLDACAAPVARTAARSSWPARSMPCWPTNH